jgi:sugar lactone lactonase YvrE
METKTESKFARIRVGGSVRGARSRRSKAWALLAGSLAAIGLAVGGQSHSASAATGDVSTPIGVSAGLIEPWAVAVDGSGDRFVADFGNNVIRKVTAAGVVSVFAGSGVAGFADGQGTAASFSGPTGVALDGSGNVYVSDFGNNRIRKVTFTGLVSTLAGNGAEAFADGPGASASFSAPYGIAVDGSGNVFVADNGNERIRMVTPAGVVSTLAGNGVPAFADGPGASASFYSPYGVAVDGSGNVYVADYGNNRIRTVTSAGVVSTLAGTGTPAYGDGANLTATFNSPVGVAVNSAGNVFVSDFGNRRIRKIAGGSVSTLAGDGTEGSADGPGGTASFRAPYGIAVDSTLTGESLLVADFGNSVIRRVELDVAAPAGDVFVPVPVSRLLDTRDVGAGGPVLVGTTRNLTVTGVSGVPANATAVALNVAAVSPLAPGHLRVFPAGEPLPTASVLNFALGKNTANHVITKVGAAGQISMYAGNTTHVIVDVNGYFTNTASGSTYVPVVTRTRLTTLTLAGAVVGNPAASSVDVVVAGAGGNGADAVTVAVDIGAINPTATAHLRVFPAGSPLPNASTHNFVVGDSRMNLVLVNPGTGGAITIYNASAGPLTLTVDTVGYFHPGAGLAFLPLTPIRPLDTRLGAGTPLAAGAFVEVQIRGFGGVPNTTKVRAVVVNVAAVNPSATGSIDIGPSGVTPTLPWFTHPASENVANLAIVPVGADGKIRLVNNSAGTSHLIVDITGYLTL